MNGFRRGRNDIESVKDDIRRRLAKVCAGWTDEDRERLVNQVTMNELRFPSGRLITDLAVESEALRLDISSDRSS